MTREQPRVARGAAERTNRAEVATLPRVIGPAAIDCSAPPAFGTGVADVRHSAATMTMRRTARKTTVPDRAAFFSREPNTNATPAAYAEVWPAPHPLLEAHSRARRE